MGKVKSHSGAKKRLKLLASGKIKRKKVGLRHLLVNHNSKNKRHLGKGTYVHDANVNQMKRVLNF